MLTGPFEGIDLVRCFELAAERAQYVEAILGASDRFARLNAIRGFYEKAWKEIKEEAPHVWAIDPYESRLNEFMTPIEFSLWQDIRQEGCVLYPQYPVGRFFVDFGNPVARVAVECDGAAYHQDAEKDGRRQREIESMGWCVYRLTGRQCLEDFKEVKDRDTGDIRLVASDARNLIREIGRHHGISNRYVREAR